MEGREGREGREEREGREGRVEKHYWRRVPTISLRRMLVQTCTPR